MNYDTLTAELAKPEYAGLTDREAADKLNAKTVHARRLVPLWQVKTLGMEAGWWMGAKAAVATNPYAAALMEYYADSRLENIDLDNDGAIIVTTGLVSTGLVTQTQADAIDALAYHLISPAESLGLEEIGLGHVSSARAIIAENNP